MISKKCVFKLKDKFKEVTNTIFTDLEEITEKLKKI